MGKLICDSCGNEVSSFSARYGYDTIFCKNCYGTEKAKEIIKKRREEPEKEALKKMEIEKELEQLNGDFPYHFKALLSYGKISSAIGWIIVIIGVIVFFVGFANLEFDGALGISAILGGIFISILGIGMVIGGQLVSCFVSIEKNTRSTYEILKSKS